MKTSKYPLLETLFQLLSMKKNIYYKKGLLQGFVSCGAITQQEWQLLFDDINQKKHKKT